MRYTKLWAGLAAVIVGSFGLLGYFGFEIYRQAPPIPDRVVSESGRVLFTADQIRDGQSAWQSMGSQEVGTVWGHGGYVAPDWSADWLHREATWILDRWAQAEHGKTYTDLSDEQQAALRARLQRELRTNRYDPATGTLTVSDTRARAIDAVGSHYDALFGVYGMLGLGLMLFCLKGLAARYRWKTRVLAFAFWAINVGLGLRVLLSVLPVGLMQAWASIEHGMWYARSPEFLKTPLMDDLRWMRVVGDTLFGLGALAFGWFVLGLKTGWSIKSTDTDLPSPADTPRGAADRVGASEPAETGS